MIEKKKDSVKRDYIYLNNLGIMIQGARGSLTAKEFVQQVLEK
jgi:hypothetical protein